MCKNPRHIQLVFKKGPTSDIELDQSTKIPEVPFMKPSLILYILSEVEIFLLMNCKTID